MFFFFQFCDMIRLLDKGAESIDEVIDAEMKKLYYPLSVGGGTSEFG